jgi:hypothetical protein
MSGTTVAAERGARPRGRGAALTLALTGIALSVSAAPAAADSSACTHHFSGPQICVRLDGRGGRNAVTALWTNPPANLMSRPVSLYRDGSVIATATATRSGRALSHTWPSSDTGTDTELCVKFRGSERMACQTTR